MTLEKALDKVITSKEFKEAAKTDALLRVQLKEIRHCRAGFGLKCNLLTRFGYKIQAIK